VGERTLGDRRLVSPLLHLDAAAGSRASQATVDAIQAHLRLETELGIYPAEAVAAETIERLRGDLAELFGVPAAGVALVEGATAALDTLLTAWPLPAGAAVGMLPSEWGPNVDTFRARGLTPVELPADPSGLLALEAFEQLLRTAPPALAHVTQVPAHRGLRQPVETAAQLCRSFGVPLWVDAAQAVGQTEVATGADAVYGTSRKWLAGPRGVGFLAIDPANWATLTPPRTARFEGLPPVWMLESGDAHVAGRVGLANAVREYVDAGPAARHRRLSLAGDLTREVLGDVPGWQVVAGWGPITGLRAIAGQDPVSVRDRLLREDQILVTVSMPWRAAELTEPWLRVSAQADTTTNDLERLVQGLTNP
jgi:pyridoxal 5-phosphate dependent beta-lyase